MTSPVLLLTNAVILATVLVLVFNFGFSGTFYGAVEVRGNLKGSTSEFVSMNATTSEIGTLGVTTRFQLPLDTPDVDAEIGALRLDSSTEKVQVYGTSGWEDVGDAGGPGDPEDPVIPFETVEGLVAGVDDPLVVATLESSFTSTVTVNSEATFNSATAAAAENTRIQLTADISCAAALTIPDKALWIDLNGFTLTVPVVTTFSIICQQSGKNIYFSGGTIGYNATGTTGSSSSLIRTVNGFLYIRNVTLLHAEYAVSVQGSTGRVVFYTSGCVYRMDKARSSNNNTYGPIGVFGMSTDDSYLYIRDCVFDTAPGDTYLTSATDRYIMRGAVRFANSTHVAGSCTMTGCTINPAHRMQAVIYSDIFPSTGVRGTFRLLLDNNVIGDAGPREQLVIVIGSVKPLNYFETINMVENTFDRMDSNKGVIYIDSTSGGSTDVISANNTIPPMKGIGAIGFAATYERVGNTVTVTTPSEHNFTVGYDITVTSSAGGLSNGTYIIQTIVSPTEFTILDAVSGAATGTTTVIDNYATSTRKLVSKDGFARGPSTLTRVYLQKYSI